MTPRPAEAPVRYARTEDMVDIAYVMEGQGLNSVVLPFHFSHMAIRWGSSIDWARGLAQKQRVLSYDSRGQGLSTRSLARPPRLEDYARDLSAVLQKSGFDSAAILAYGGFSHVALRYAVACPERVTALILLCPSESFSSWPMLGMTALADENWELFVELLAAKFPFEPGRAAYADFVRASTSSAAFVQMVRAFAESDVSHLLPLVTVPTLVLHSKNQHWLSPEAGARFAAQIPGAEMVLLDGDSEPESSQGIPIIERFLAANGLAGRSPQPSTLDLSERQLEVLRLVALGRTNREVAAELFLSERTVERHLGDIYDRLGVRNRAEAIALAVRHG